MHNSKLMDMISKFSAKELRRFDEFVHSPFFNKYERLEKLIEIIRAVNQDYTHESLSKENVHTVLFPGEPYKEQKVKDLMSYLVKLLEDFMSFQNYSNDDLAKNRHMLTELRTRRWDKYFLKRHKEIQKNHDKSPYRDETFYFNQMLLEAESDQYFIEHERRHYDESLQKKVDNLDIYYLSAKLKNCCEMMNRKNVISAEYNFYMLDDILGYLEKNAGNYEHVPAITIYYQILLTLVDPDNEVNFQELKKLVVEHEEVFSAEELRHMYQYAQNYCSRKINQGDPKYMEEIFGLYNLLLEKGIIYDGQYFPQAVFKNMVSVGIRLERYDWVKNFIESHIDKVNPEHQENAYAYNMASYFYARQDYRGAIKLLQNVEFTDVFYHLGAKSMLMKIYYESDEYEALLSLIDAFKVYLRRNKLVSKYQYEIHDNLIKNVKRIVKLRTGPYSNRPSVVKQKLQEIKKRVTEEEEVANKQWFLEKVEEFGVL